MKQCPQCHIGMRENPKYGVMLDICPQCKGVWLDRGELQKIISLTREFEDEHDDLYQHYQKSHEYQKHYEPSKNEYEKHYDYHKGHDRHYHHKKKKHPLIKIMGEIFD